MCKAYCTFRQFLTDMTQMPAEFGSIATATAPATKHRISTATFGEPASAAKNAAYESTTPSPPSPPSARESCPV